MQDEGTSPHERLHLELSMLEAMYPEQIKWSDERREVMYTDKEPHASLTIRIPEEYFISAMPEILTATVQKRDVRDQMQTRTKQCDLGVEIIDVLLDEFRQMANEIQTESNAAQTTNNTDSREDVKSTVIVWLHHLLNTNKRKQALSPPLAGVSGVTKPGYPGVLVYAGPSDAVEDHVRALKSLNWQAFQIRLELEEEWTFKHGTGVVEVESMAEMVADIGPQRKQEFLQAVHIA